MMISNAVYPAKKSQRESLLRCAGCASIYVWMGCDLVVVYKQVVGDRDFGDHQDPLLRAPLVFENQYLGLANFLGGKMLTFSQILIFIYTPFRLV